MHYHHTVSSMNSVAWKREQTAGAQYLVKTFEIDSFEQLHTFLQRISTTGNALAHDPEVGQNTVTPRKPGTVKIMYTTNDKGKVVTELDHMMAVVTDRVYELVVTEC